MADIGKLEEAALKRKAKLAELKAKRFKNSDQEGDSKEEAAIELPKPIFRSYKPQDDLLQENVLPDGVPGEISERVREEISTENEGVKLEQLDFTNLAPRKPDWDLKRDIASKLEKLERRTQRAIAELIRERLQDEDLANAVTAGASAARQLAGEDDDD